MYISYATRIMMIIANARLNVGYESGPLQGLIQVRPAEPGHRLFMGEAFNNLARSVGALPAPFIAAPRRNEQGPIVLHVGGRLDKTGFDKRWPLRKYVELAERCAELGHPVKLLWGPGDPAPEANPPVVVEYCSSTESLFEILNETKLFVCNNTGVLWAACLAGVFTISFGAPFFLPVSNYTEILKETNYLLMGDPCCDCTDYICKKGNCIHDIPVETMLQIVRAKVGFADDPARYTAESRADFTANAK